MVPRAQLRAVPRRQRLTTRTVRTTWHPIRPGGTSLPVRLLCHSLDEPHVQFDPGHLMRGMSTSRVLDEAKLCPVVPHIAGTRFGLGGSLERRRRDVKSLWRGGRRSRIRRPVSRRNVSRPQEFLGCHLLVQEVERQTCIAISSVKRVSRGVWSSGGTDRLLGVLHDEVYCELDADVHVLTREQRLTGSTRCARNLQ